MFLCKNFFGGGRENIIRLQWISARRSRGPKKKVYIISNISFAFGVYKLADIWTDLCPVLSERALDQYFKMCVCVYQFVLPKGCPITNV